MIEHGLILNGKSHGFLDMLPSLQYGTEEINHRKSDYFNLILKEIIGFSVIRNNYLILLPLFIKPILIGS